MNLDFNGSGLGVYYSKRPTLRNTCLNMPPQWQTNEKHTKGYRYIISIPSPHPYAILLRQRGRYKWAVCYQVGLRIDCTSTSDAFAILNHAAAVMEALAIRKDCRLFNMRHVLLDIACWVRERRCGNGRGSSLIYVQNPTAVACLSPAQLGQYSTSYRH